MSDAASIVDLDETDADGRRQAAEVLYEAFRALGNRTWPSVAVAEKEVSDCLQPPRLCRALVLNGRVVAWGGLRPMYGTVTWELHPLVVHPDAQGRGLGGRLLTDLEHRARERGATGILLGSDDQTGSTSLSAVDFSTTPVGDAIAVIASIPGRPPHPWRFYASHGYRIVGVIPDANGPGEPDILMWKGLGGG